MAVDIQTKGKGQWEQSGADGPGEGVGDEATDPQDRADPDVPAGRRRDENAGPGLGGGPERGVAVPLLPEQARPPRGGAGGAGVPPLQPLQAPLVDLAGAGAGTETETENENETEELNLADLLTDVLVSMFEVEDFVRLMIGEAIRGESTARAVGLDLFTSFQDHIEEWITKNRPDLHEHAGAGDCRLLSAMVVGVFVLHCAGVIGARSRMTSPPCRCSGPVRRPTSSDRRNSAGLGLSSLLLTLRTLPSLRAPLSLPPTGPAPVGGSVRRPSILREVPRGRGSSPAAGRSPSVGAA